MDFDVSVIGMTRCRRAALRFAYRGLQVWWFVRRPDTHGVKLVIRSDDEVLFVRHAYGNRRAWEFPGGGRRRGEGAADAACREAREELGIQLRGWTSFGELLVRDHATAHLTCLATAYDGQPLRLDLGELLEARWARPDLAPQPLGRDAAAVIDLDRFEGVIDDL